VQLKWSLVIGLDPMLCRWNLKVGAKSNGGLSSLSHQVSTSVISIAGAGFRGEAG
jgi:hypothetical protein